MFKKALGFYFLFSFSFHSSLVFAQTQTATAIIPSAEDFAAPDDRSFSISSDGKKIALLSGENLTSKLIVLDSETGKETPIYLGKDVKPRDISWGDNDHVLITITYTYNLDQFHTKEAYKIERARTISYSLSKKKSNLLVPTPGQNNDSNLPIIYIDNAKQKAIMIGGYFKLSEIVGIFKGQNNEDAIFNVSAFEVDIDSGKGKEISTGNQNTSEFYADLKGTPRLRLDEDPKGKKVELYDLSSKKAKVFLKWDDVYEMPFTIEGFLDAENVLILEIIEGKKTAIKLNLLTGEKKPLFPNETRNVSNIISDKYSKRPLAIEYDGNAKNKIIWLDEKLEKIQNTLEKTFADKYINIFDWDEARNNILVEVYNGNQKDQVFIYKSDKKSVSELNAIPESFIDYEFPTKTLEKFKASDGLEIPVFITRPKNPNKKKLPAILLPHGGPKSQDNSNFDYMSQFLASRGYIVIQPQFRGSTGYGKAFSDAGYGEWAGKMQTDTIEALDYAITKGDIDKNRVCMVGASYGGYSALVGAAQDADKFKCAISYGGVSDLAGMQLTAENKSGGVSGVVAYWRDHMGVTRYDSAKIHAISPLYMVDKIKSPVLLMHGTDDTVVMPEQSQKMYAALKKAGKDVKYIELKDEDHWLSREKTRTQFLTEMENFLAPILKPQE